MIETYKYVSLRVPLDLVEEYTLLYHKYGVVALRTGVACTLFPVWERIDVYCVLCQIQWILQYSTKLFYLSLILYLTVKSTPLCDKISTITSHLFHTQMTFLRFSLLRSLSLRTVEAQATQIACASRSTVCRKTDCQSPCNYFILSGVVVTLF